MQSLLQPLTLVVLLSLGVVMPLQAQVPSLLNYQGRLATDGNPATGSHSVTFSIYGSPTGGSLLWSETQTVTASDGVFNALLGSVTPFPGDLFSGGARYLGIRIGSGQEMSPRLRFTSVAFALRAREADAVVDGAVNSAALSDGAVTTAKLAPNAAVRTLNGLTGPVTLAAAGGATISTSGNTITINAGSGSGGGSGVQNIQNTDETLEINNPNGPTTTINLRNGGVSTAKIANGAIVQAKLADDAVGSAKIADNAVTSDKIASNAVTSAKIADNAILSAKIASSAVTSAKIASNAVTSDKIASTAAVKTLNTLTGNVNLVGGNNVTITQSGNNITISSSILVPSSIRWKTDVQPLEGALDKVQRLRGVSYTWKDDGRADIGLIAEEVGQVIPEVVVFEENGRDASSVNYAQLVAMLVEAIKEQQQEIAAQQAAIEGLADRLARLEEMMQQASQATTVPSAGSTGRR